MPNTPSRKKSARKHKLTKSEQKKQKQRQMAALREKKKKMAALLEKEKKKKKRLHKTNHLGIHSKPSWLVKAGLWSQAVLSIRL